MTAEPGHSFWVAHECDRKLGINLSPSGETAFATESRAVFFMGWADGFIRLLAQVTRRRAFSGRDWVLPGLGKSAGFVQEQCAGD